MMELEPKQEDRKQLMGVELTSAAEKAVEKDTGRNYPVTKAEAYEDTERMNYSLDSATLEILEDSELATGYDEDHVSQVYGETSAD